MAKAGWGSAEELKAMRPAPASCRTMLPAVGGFGACVGRDLPGDSHLLDYEGTPGEVRRLTGMRKGRNMVTFEAGASKFGAYGGYAVAAVLAIAMGFFMPTKKSC